MGIGDWGLGPIPNPHLFKLKYDYANFNQISKLIYFKLKIFIIKNS